MKKAKMVVAVAQNLRILGAEAIPEPSITQPTKVGDFEYDVTVFYKKIISLKYSTN